MPPTISLAEPFLHAGQHIFEVELQPLTDGQRLEILAINGGTSQVMATVAAATGLSIDTVEEMSLADIHTIASNLQ
jgi:hypothetical protein